MIIIVVRIIATFIMAGSVTALAALCEYPNKPINWILRYCAMSVGSDDETLIRSSQCFKTAEKDSQSTKVCSMNEKYKKALCRDFLMESKKYVSMSECLSDDEIAPYVPG